jgi:hypothetical protein
LIAEIHCFASGYGGHSIFIIPQGTAGRPAEVRQPLVCKFSVDFSFTIVTKPFAIVAGEIVP